VAGRSGQERRREEHESHDEDNEKSDALDELPSFQKGSFRGIAGQRNRALKSTTGVQDGKTSVYVVSSKAQNVEPLYPLRMEDPTASIFRKEGLRRARETSQVDKSNSERKRTSSDGVQIADLVEAKRSRHV